ncbi:MAG: RidA family protein [Variovorax sp.]
MSRVDRNSATIAAPVGTYSHGVSVEGPGKWLHVAGQVGLSPDGRLGDGFEAQARLAWTNLVAVLKDARMEVADLVKVTSYLVEPEHMSLLGPVRAPFLGAARPASTVVIVKALARPEWLFEVDAVAWRE